MTVWRLSPKLRHIEWQTHNWERWLGLAAVPNAEIHRADRVDQAATPWPAAFQIDAGNTAWGNWVQVLGSADTPVVAGCTFYTLDRIFVTAVERIFPYFIQISFGATAAGALGSDDFTTLVYAPVLLTGSVIPIDVMTMRQPVTTKAWIRCVCPGQNTATLDFYIGLYSEPD